MEEPRTPAPRRTKAAVAPSRSRDVHTYDFSAGPTNAEVQARQQRNVIHYPCKYVPVELLRGFGATLVPVDFEAESFEDADRLAHPNLCGYGKSLIAYALKPEVRCLVLTSCCDVMRRAYDVLAAQGCLDFLWLVDLPHLLGPAEDARFREELERLADAWAAFSGEVFDVGRAIAAFSPMVPRSDERVTLLGAHGPKSLLTATEEAFEVPVENLTCTGGRFVASPPPNLGRAPQKACHLECDASAPETSARERFLDWYAPALLHQMPCLRMADVRARETQVGTPGQTGIVYHTMKFCDYYGFEYLQLAAESPVPVLKVETDGTAQSAGQLRTRLKAFDETLAGNVETHLFKRGKHADNEAETDVEKAAYVLGVDSGSTSTDAVILDADGQRVASAIVPTGSKATESARKAIDTVLGDAGLEREDITLAVATGYGREGIPDMDTGITEITCHARGAHELAPEVRTIIDIGGQDSKVIVLDDAGNVANFVMNDKCAAGTGRFLEMMARTLEMPLDQFCAAGLQWKKDVKISSMCTVFAESEVVSLVADDTPVADIIHGLDNSVASKIKSLAKRVKATGPYLMTGGVANNEGVVTALGEALGADVATHEDSQLCGALGAALLGLESLR